MSKPKTKKKKRKKTQHERDLELARQILQCDLHDAMVQKSMVEMCFELEKKRKPGDYIR